MKELSILFALAATAMFGSPPSTAASPPGTPLVTLGADMKQLVFDWDDVPGASYYRLLVKAGDTSYSPLIDHIPASTTQARLNIAVHLLKWTTTRYAVAACNSSGCTSSALVSPQNVMLDAIGYFKASNTESGDQFGRSLVLSDDGRTLAIVGPSEDSNAAGVDGDQADNSASLGETGAVYVFRRSSGGWQQTAYIKAGVNQPNQWFGSSLFFESNSALAINADGSLLAVGAANQDLGGLREAGIVYIYQKSSSGSWSLAATLTAPAPLQFDQFGLSLDMSLDGRTLRVSSFGPFLPIGPDMTYYYQTHLFVRPGTTWLHSATLTGAVDGDICQNTRLSRDGQTLVATCDSSLPERHLETFKRSGDTWTNVAVQQLDSGASGIGLALDFDAHTMALQEARYLERGFVRIYKWTGASWVREAGIAPPPAPDNPYGIEFGKSLALNRTGDILAIGDSSVAEEGAGVSPVSMPGHAQHGAVYIWRRDSRNPTTWIMRSVVKSPNPDEGDRFGISFAMCGTGHALAVGAYGEDSKAKGVDGDRADNSAASSGAAYLY